MGSLIETLLKIDSMNSLFVSSVISAFVTLLIILLFRPCIKILKVCKAEVCGRPVIKIYLKNKGIFAATNIKCEVCFLQNNFTYHLEFKRDDFLILPSRFKSESERVFKSYGISEDTKLAICSEEIIFSDFLNEWSDKPLRVRVHANHGFTGFGKAFEKTFQKIDLS